jgi:hypothetical protein
LIASCFEMNSTRPTPGVSLSTIRRTRSMSAAVASLFR